MDAGREERHETCRTARHSVGALGWDLRRLRSDSDLDIPILEQRLRSKAGILRFYLTHIDSAEVVSMQFRSACELGTAYREWRDLS